MCKQVKDQFGVAPIILLAASGEASNLRRVADEQGVTAVFDQFLELTDGVTTILISHRFSTVRRADRIVVLEEGAVVEEGTHSELLAGGGRYAELFRLQAERFGG